MNIVRLSTAYGLALLFYDFFIRKKYVMSILFLISAALFHRASLVLLIFFAAYFVFRRYRGHFTTLIVALVAMPLLPLLLRLAGNILPYYNSYLNSIYADNQFGLGSFLILGVQLVIFFLTILPYYPAKTCNLLKSRKNLLRQARTSLNLVVSIKDTRPKEYIFLLALFFAVIFAMMSLVFNILDRTVQFFSVVALVQLPESISRYYPPKKQFWVRTSVICGFLLYIAIIVYLRPEWNRVFPYRFID